ncbi:MAG: hypothetical protein ABIH26_08315 [Candidatus Eisenbacteria bacterium]
MAEPTERDVSEKLRLLEERFFARTDRVAILARWGRPCPVNANGAFADLLAGHILGRRAPSIRAQYTSRGGTKEVVGRFRVGSYAPAPDGTTPWICIDLDGEGHAFALEDPKVAAVEVHRRFAEHSLPAFLEKSGGGHGWHVWCFVEAPIPASKARRLARAMIPEGILLANGDEADVDQGRGVEIFPKQDRIADGGTGNCVWLPWWSGAPEGANEFYCLHEDGEVERFDPEMLATIAEADVDRVLSERPAPNVERRGERSATEGSGGWREWRAEALAALPLDQVYGDLLTGRARPDGWLECRDPWSPTGDRDPSAGVADTTPQAERGAFHSFISGRTLSVFDFLVERGTATTIRDAFQLVARLSNIDLPSPARKEVAEKSDDGQPSVQVNNRQLIDVIEDAWAAILAANRKPFLFVRAGRLVRIERSQGGVLLADVDEDSAYGMLARVARWCRMNEKGDLSDVPPPRSVAKDMIAYPHENLPRLDSIVASPVLTRSGKLIRRRGYHKREQLWYEPPARFRIGRIPSSPTQEEIERAKTLLLDDLLVDFPFAAESDRAHALAAILLPLARRLIDDCAPIHLVEAPCPGSGKGLLADVVSLIAEGRPCQVTTIARDEAETRKKITAMLSRGSRVILVDNIRDALDSDQLASALTAKIWSDRVLGTNRMIDLPNQATWLVTANNPRVSLELARRSVRIRLDPKVDQPWKREGFRHDPLREWVAANRGRLLAAALTLIRAWIAGGRPQGDHVLGSFEEWAHVMGGILDFIGVSGFLGSQDELYELADAEGQEWREFVLVWWREHQGDWVRAKDLHAIAEREDLLPLTRGTKGERSERIRMGQKLSRMRSRALGTYRIEAVTDKDSNSIRYRLVPTESGEVPMQTEVAAAGSESVAEDIPGSPW